MKQILLIIAILFFSFGYVQSKGLKDIEQIEFSTSTRSGDFKEIIVSNKNVNAKIGNRRGNNLKLQIIRKIKKKEYRLLKKSLKQISLASFPALKSPTNKRAFDGAAHSIIRIKTKDGKVHEHRFDDLTPHQKLQKLLQAILQFLPDEQM